MLHLIAYRDQTGKDFNGLPWLRIAPDDIDGAEKLYNEMCEEYKDVVLVECEDSRFEEQENITWDFVDRYRLLPF